MGVAAAVLAWLKAEGRQRLSRSASCRCRLSPRLVSRLSGWRRPPPSATVRWSPRCQPKSAAAAAAGCRCRCRLLAGCRPPLLEGRWPRCQPPPSTRWPGRAGPLAIAAAAAAAPPVLPPYACYAVAAVIGYVCQSSAAVFALFHVQLPLPRASPLPKAARCCCRAGCPPLPLGCWLPPPCVKGRLFPPSRFSPRVRLPVQVRRCQGATPAKFASFRHAAAKRRRPPLPPPPSASRAAGWLPPLPPGAPRWGSRRCRCRLRQAAAAAASAAAGWGSAGRGRRPAAAKAAAAAASPSKGPPSAAV